LLLVMDENVEASEIGVAVNLEERAERTLDSSTRREDGFTLGPGVTVIAK
jgi:hypothetical protein